MGLKDKALTTEQEQKKHVHRWIFKTRDEDECDQLYNGNPCIAKRVSQAELEHREAEWSDYYQKVTTTEAYKNTQDMVKAWAAGDKKWIKEIRARIAKRVEKINDLPDTDKNWVFKANDYLPKPDTPDPRQYPYEVKI